MEAQNLGPWAVEDIFEVQEYEAMLGQERLRKRYLEHPELLSQEALGGAEKLADAITAGSAILKLAALPEEKIALYGMVVEGLTEGVFLETAGEVCYFDWIYMTAQALPPEIALRDFDRDKEKELAVFLHVLSGTEYSIEQLLMLKKEADGAWGVTEFAVEDIQEELAQDISWRFTEEESILEFYETETGRVIGEEKLTEILETGETLDSVSFGNIMDFDTGDAEGEESEIRLNFEIRYGVNGEAIGRYGAHFISAQVRYDGSNFALEDYQFFTRGMFGSKTE